jgi:hypothetical protein
MNVRVLYSALVFSSRTDYFSADRAVDSYHRRRQQLPAAVTGNKDGILSHNGIKLRL